MSIPTNQSSSRLVYILQKPHHGNYIFTLSCGSVSICKITRSIIGSCQHSHVSPWSLISDTLKATVSVVNLVRANYTLGFIIFSYRKVFQVSVTMPMPGQLTGLWGRGKRGICLCIIVCISRLVQVKSRGCTRSSPVGIPNSLLPLPKPLMTFPCEKYGKRVAILPTVPIVFTNKTQPQCRAWHGVTATAESEFDC